jgi:GH25 family lysozyme M1 (1,4-beta-N-acetylmuramidase)
MMDKIFLLLFLISLMSCNNYYKGLDVSVYQRDIDWNKIKLNFDFAIIRMGFGKNGVDKYWDINYANAKAAGVPIGTYLFSYANNEADSAEEAQNALSLLNGKQFEWPIFYDIEGDAANSKVNEKFKTFCDILSKANYLCGLYSGASRLNSKYNDDIKDNYPIWVAHWGVEQPKYSKQWGIWQYTSKGKVDGIKGNVDLDYAQIYYPDMIMSQHLNGY